ncbi:MAG: YafY family transcriptional regulator [Actinomycetota bacterium]|nr:YafY family transcriptional regulator [Actinomycetota bacterium]
MSASADRVPRLLALIPYLQANPDIEITSAASDFGVSADELREDLNLLWMCGLPGHGPGDLIDLSFDDDHVAVTFDAGMSRPLRLTTHEAVALIVALRTLAATPGLIEQEAVSRALAKIEEASGAQAQAAAAVTVSVDGQDAALAVLRRALRAGQAVHLTYYSAGRDARTERTVDPMRLLLVAGHWYLEAWCRRAEGVRMFRLDRIEELDQLDEPSRPPPEIALRDISGGLFLPSPEDVEVRLRLLPWARWVADYYPCQSVVADGDELLVTLRSSETTWVRRLVAGLGGAAQVLDPPALAAEIAQDARQALAAYGISAGQQDVP